ncbi:ABC transporter permease [Leucobacter sp. PH1c]|uniref:ABC transporter permease n=1 Tax=Leucobacter sp. PH1c TaxID=1397278 RepID=UPI00046A61C2|nr:ABC transporter permease [Leucobacter sp. PH1c]
MRAIIVKEFRELARDRRTLAMLVVLPVLLLVIFGYAANFAVDRIDVAVIGSGSSELSTDLERTAAAQESITLVHPGPGGAGSDRDRATALLRDRAADAVVIAQSPEGASAAPGGASAAPGGASISPSLAERMEVLLDGSSLFTAQSAQGVFLQIIAEDGQRRAAQIRAAAEAAQGDAVAAQSVLTALASAPAASADPGSFITVAFNPDLRTSWVMVPGLIGLILLFIGALITSIGLVRERETRTLEQLAVMPLRPSAIIFGKIAPYFLLALVDMAAVTALGVWVFGVPFVGSVPVFTVAALVFLLVVLGAGVFISSVSQSTGQAIQMAILFVVPQVLLSGLIFPLEAMPLGVRWIGYALPLTWFREISQGIMLRGAGLDTLWPPLTILAGMAVLVFGAATLRMRRSLTHGGAR